MFNNSIILSELINASKKVVNNWEKGDLAAAVRNLSCVLEEVQEEIDSIKANPAIVDQARSMYTSDDIEIPEVPLMSRHEDGGAWVSAWVFVPPADADQEGEPEEPLTGIHLIASVLEKIADIKTSSLIRDFAPAYFKDEGIEIEVPLMPGVPNLSSVDTMEDLSAAINAYDKAVEAQFPEESYDMSGIMEHGKGSKFFNELPLGSAAEHFFCAYQRIMGVQEGAYVVEMYDLNTDVFVTNNMMEADDFAELIAPCTVFELDNSTNPPQLHEVGTY